MINKKQLTDFLLKARTNTYASNTGQISRPLLQGSKQFEYSEGSWLYRDIYNQGKKRFVGLETIYYENEPVWSESYYGNFEKMTEKEVDRVLRKALIDKSTKVRIWHDITYKIGEYTYTNNGSGSIDELEGSEEIKKNGKTIYYLYYAGATIS